MMKATKFLKDSKGNDSSNRLAFLLILLNALFIGDYLALTGATVTEVITIITTLIGLAITIKTIGKNQENSELKIENNGKT